MRIVFPTEENLEELSEFTVYYVLKTFNTWLAPIRRVK